MRVLIAACVVLLAGCGSRSAVVPPTTASAPTTVKKKLPPALSAADRRFVGTELAYAREDVVAGTLAARKASSPSLHGAALRRVRTVKADIAALTRLGPPARLTAAQRRSYETYYESLVDNAGYLLDNAYERGAEARDVAEAALARRPLVRTKSLARRIVRERTADDALLRTIGG